MITEKMIITLYFVVRFWKRGMGISAVGFLYALLLCIHFAGAAEYTFGECPVFTL